MMYYHFKFRLLVGDPGEWSEYRSSVAGPFTQEQAKAHATNQIAVMTARTGRHWVCDYGPAPRVRWSLVVQVAIFIVMIAALTWRFVR